ncbi:MAG: glycosyltransferase [Ancalomicrobiaceae bacterium]|nr:glycosyltransferase [Ancalomicrobiaceae bacterium]
MKVAIVHYWLVGMRGGEKVIESLCRLFPEADVYTHVYDPSAISTVIKSHQIRTTFISRLPFAVRNYKSYLPLMPLALEQLDLSAYDVIISSESGPAKGIIPPPNALHVCYCHSPMRYIWNMFHEYHRRSGFVTRMAMPALSHYLRNWDVISSTRTHHFVANSRNVAQRLQTYYRRDATVIYPPVSVGDFAAVPHDEVGDYWLMVGELVAYKRPDLAIEAFNRAGKRLVVIGGGEMLSRLRAAAGPTVTILGPQPFDVLRHHYARCRALVFPGEEDFGIVPVEAMASGRPVIAFKRGGATESVVDGTSGVFFDNQTVEDLLQAVARCEALQLDPAAIVAHAQQFSAETFAARMKAFVDERLAERGMAA